MKLPTLKPREVIRALEKAGCAKVRQKGSHDRMVHSDGRKVTVPNHPGEDIGRGLLKKILRDSKFDPADFG